jgi:hypothetical protein
MLRVPLHHDLWPTRRSRMQLPANYFSKIAAVTFPAYLANLLTKPPQPLIELRSLDHRRGNFIFVL